MTQTLAELLRVHHQISLKLVEKDELVSAIFFNSTSNDVFQALSRNKVIPVSWKQVNGSLSLWPRIESVMAPYRLAKPQLMELFSSLMAKVIYRLENTFADIAFHTQLGLAPKELAHDSYTPLSSPASNAKLDHNTFILVERALEIANGSSTPTESVAHLTTHEATYLRSRFYVSQIFQANRKLANTLSDDLIYELNLDLEHLIESTSPPMLQESMNYKVDHDEGWYSALLYLGAPFVCVDFIKEMASMLKGNLNLYQLDTALNDFQKLFVEHIARLGRENESIRLGHIDSKAFGSASPRQEVLMFPQAVKSAYLSSTLEWNQRLREDLSSLVDSKTYDVINELIPDNLNT